jgi:hypothetical protein
MVKTKKKNVKDTMEKKKKKKQDQVAYKGRHNYKTKQKPQKPKNLIFQ